MLRGQVGRGGKVAWSWRVTSLGQERSHVLVDKRKIQIGRSLPYVQFVRLSTLLYSVGGILHLDLGFAVRPAALYPFSELDTVNILKVKSSLLRGFLRYWTPQQRVRTLSRVRAIEGLNALGHTFHPGASSQELIHPSASRHFRIAQAERIVASGSEGPTVGKMVTLNRKRFGAVQVASTVLLPPVLTKDPLVAEEAQLGRTVFFLQVLFVARVDMSPLWAGRPARMNNTDPQSADFPSETDGV